MFGKLIDRAVKKPWSSEEIRKYMGVTSGAFLTHASSAELREKAASGGSTTAILCALLETGHIDGAVVCRAEVIDSRVRARMIVATTVDEIRSAQGSKYVETPFLKEALPLIRAFHGRVAVTALPCDVSALRRHMQRDEALAQKVRLVIGVICGHNSRKELIDATVRRIEAQTGSPITRYRFRVGHWRGRLEAECANGQLFSRPSSHFNDYQNLFYFCQKKCMACEDHFGYETDLSVGDVWLYRLRADPIKHTAIITRNDSGDHAVRIACAQNAIVTEALDVEDILDGQSRIAPFHYNVSARAKVGRLLGIKLKDKVQEPVRWHSWLAALITMSNMKFSQSERRAKWIFRVPRPLLKCYLYALKGLETLR